MLLAICSWPLKSTAFGHFASLSPSENFRKAIFTQIGSGLVCRKLVVLLVGSCAIQNKSKMVFTSLKATRTMIHFSFVTCLALCISAPKSSIFHYFVVLSSLHSEVRARRHTLDDFVRMFQSYKTLLSGALCSC